MVSVWERRAEAHARNAAESACNALYDRPAMLELIGPVAGLDDLSRGVRGIVPVIAARFPLWEAAQANALLESGKVIGNIVLVAPEPS